MNLKMLMNKSALITTLGCRLNQADTALLRGRLRNAGYVLLNPTAPASTPDLVIVNSCVVTSTAAAKSRKALRTLRRKFPDSIVVAAGCGTRASRDFLENEDAADIVLKDNTGIVQAVRRFESGMTQEIPPKKKTPIFREETVSEYPFRSRAFLKVQEGCNSFCTYCIVPHARGRERSRDWDEVLDEAGKLCSRGHREIVLTGVNISAYSCGNRSISDLVEALLEIPGKWRLRLSSMEPHPENGRILDLISSSEKLCRFLHLPLQHGSEEILKAMGRNYTPGEFRDFALEASERIKGIHLGTDIIAGFPGETGRLFAESRDFVSSLPLANLHVFRFSPRQGTPAADFADRVHSRAARSRHSELAALSRKLKADFLEGQVGGVLEVLTEKMIPGGSAEGWSDNYARVRIMEAPVNKIVRTKILRKDKTALLGETETAQNKRRINNLASSVAAEGFQ